jgi:hypothetical protein
MTKPAATATVNYLTGEPWHCPTTITRRGPERFTMYAPGWRPMAFSSLDKARAKLERHPGFVAWS